MQNTLSGQADLARYTHDSRTPVLPTTAGPLARNAFCELPRYREALCALNAVCDSPNQYLLTVCGAKGTGKSTLIAALTAQRDEPIVSVVGSNGTTVQNLIKAIATSLHLTVPLAEKGSNAQLDALIAQCDQSFNLLIDETDSLPPETLRALVHCAARQNTQQPTVTICLFGTLVLQQQVKQLKQGRDLRSENITLQSLSLAESKQYLLARVAQEPAADGIDLDDIPDMLLNHLHASARGMPAALNNAVQASLLPWIVEHRSPIKRLMTRKPASHVAYEDDWFIKITHWISWFLLVALIIVMSTQSTNREWVASLPKKVYAAVPPLYIGIERSAPTGA